MIKADSEMAMEGPVHREPEVHTSSHHLAYTKGFRLLPDLVLKPNSKTTLNFSKWHFQSLQVGPPKVSQGAGKGGEVGASSRASSNPW